MQKEKYLTVVKHAGGKLNCPDWPSNDLNGIFDALSRWPLDPSMALSDDDIWPPQARMAPFCCFAWVNCVSMQTYKPRYRTLYRGTTPLYPDHPEALSYFGNFHGYSFGFNIETDDPELIARMDAAIAANMATPAYAEAVSMEEKRRAYWVQHNKNVAARSRR